ncbi:MAG TPA: hypothetical protein VLD18_11350, partial [Verrucomicrobiae bacterium]|nr:hypothetical protein [Verrucomicrobiae bacterium]
MNTPSPNWLNRRQALRRTVLGAAAAPWLAHAAAHAADGPLYNQTAPPYPRQREFPIEKRDQLLLDTIGQAAFRFFWENAHPKTGLIKDRSSTKGLDERPVSSIAATGFGLTAYCIAAHRGWHDGLEIRDRVRRTLRWIF